MTLRLYFPSLQTPIAALILQAPVPDRETRQAPGMVPADRTSAVSL